MFTKNIIKISMLFAGIAILNQANAQYIYKFENGQSAIYTDKVPANEKRQFTVLSSKSGAIKKVVERELTTDELKEQRALEEAEKIQKIQALAEQRKDEVLLNTYSSIEDIEKMKNYELAQINHNIESNIDNIAIYKDRITTLEQTLQQNPKNTKAIEDIQTSATRLQEAQRSLDDSKRLYVQKQNKYDEDKLRYQRALSQLGKEVQNSEENEEKFNE